MESRCYATAALYGCGLGDAVLLLAGERPRERYAQGNWYEAFLTLVDWLENDGTITATERAVAIRCLAGMNSVGVGGN